MAIPHKLIVLILVLLPSMALAEPQTRPTEPAMQSHLFILHVVGVGGKMACDTRLAHAMKNTLHADVDIFDWTENDPGLHALRATERNHKQAIKVRDIILDRKKADPTGNVTITAHSAGTAIAAWALEAIPDDAIVDNVIFLAPALSDSYDLSAALRHIHGKLYCFSSEGDALLLSTGTRLLGTIDGVQADAGGYLGFVQPKTADAVQYKKLVPMPYRIEWSQYGNWGDHIGTTWSPFVIHVLCPLIAGKPPENVPTTRP